MAKNNGNKGSETSAPNNEGTMPVSEVDEFSKLIADFDAPSDWSKMGGEITGFWDFTLTPIQCKPLHAKLFDGNIDKKKPAILLIVELTKPAGVRPPKDSENGQAFVAKPGALVGVWYKPGMKAVRDLCGREVFIKYTGEKDVGKGNPMKLFDVVAKSAGTRVPVSEDTRDKSRSIPTDFDIVKPGATPEPF